MTTMRAAWRDSTPRTPPARRQVTDRAHVCRRRTYRLGQITSIDHHDGVDHVARLDGPDGGLGDVDTVRDVSHSSVLTAAAGERR